jgi:hypothetical protein
LAAARLPPPFAQQKTSMAMTPKEMSNFFAEESADSFANLDSQKVRNAPPLLELNMRLASENALMSALIDWRHQLADPREKLRSAFTACNLALELLPALDSPTPLSERFRFYDIAILAKLLDIKVPPNAISILQKCRSAGNTDLCLDYALAETIEGANNLLANTISATTFSNRKILLKDTYSAYRDLLGGKTEALRRAEENFTRRGSDGYYSGGSQIDGGGLDNSLVTDYRLAAILKCMSCETDSDHALP